jgi:flavin reductase (DIM6/NTAB) family NADH-FMN oxidoreductase RutF
MTSNPRLLPASPNALVEVPLRPRFFQSSAFFPMPVVLLSTQNADGTDNLAPYSLCFPLVSAEGHRLMLVTKTSSKTAANLHRTGRVAINFIPDEPALLANCRVLARAVPSAEKMAQSIFALVDSPRAADSPRPKLVTQAVQAFECLLVSSESQADGEHRFVLEVESIFMPRAWFDVLEHGGRGPRLPVDYGFRKNNGTWMSRPRVRVSGPRLRPTFEVVVDRSPEQVLVDFRAALARPDADVVAKIRGDVLQVGMPRPEVTTWSPSMDLRVEPRDGKAVVHGRIGPQPQVWTTFMFFHMMIAMAGLGGLMWGIGQAAAGGSAWPVWIAVIALFLHAFVAGAAFVGQGLGSDQVHRLRSFVDDVLDV